MADNIESMRYGTAQDRLRASLENDNLGGNHPLQVVVPREELQALLAWYEQSVAWDTGVTPRPWRWNGDGWLVGRDANYIVRPGGPALRELFNHDADSEFLVRAVNAYDLRAAFALVRMEEDEPDA